MIEIIAEASATSGSKVSPICATSPTATACGLSSRSNAIASGSRAQPAVPLHAAADQFRRQHAGADDGQPQMMTCADHRAFVDVPRRSHHAAGPSLTWQGPRPGTCLAGLAVAVANIDEVIALIRAAPDPQRPAKLDEPRWPAEDMATDDCTD